MYHLLLTINIWSSCDWWIIKETFPQRWNISGAVEADGDLFLNVTFIQLIQHHPSLRKPRQLKLIWKDAVSPCSQLNVLASSQLQVHELDHTSQLNDPLRSLRGLWAARLSDDVRRVVCRLLLRLLFKVVKHVPISNFWVDCFFKKLSYFIKLSVWV